MGKLIHITVALSGKVRDKRVLCICFNYNHGQKFLGHCTLKQGNSITLARQTLSTDSTLFGWGGGGGEGWTVRCFVPLVHFFIGKYQSVPRPLAMIVDAIFYLFIYLFIFSMLPCEDLVDLVHL